MTTTAAALGKRQRKSARQTQQVFSDLQALQREVQDLKLQITRLEQAVPVYPLSLENAGSLEDLKPRRQPPPGKTAMQMIQGQWPGEETTEELLAQLRALK